MNSLSVNIEREAVRITDELGVVVFVGALAVNHYTDSRTTRDIDLAMAGPLDESKLDGLGYRRKGGSSRSWYDPRGILVDIYTRDVGGIPVGWILRHFDVARVGPKQIRVICLEGLVLAKHRAGRSQDVADLRQLMVDLGRTIRWDLMEEVATGLEVAELRKVAEALTR